MNRRSLVLFLALASFWGASYMFIELGLEDLSAPVIVFLRTALAALVLLPFALRAGALSGLRGRLGAIAVLALVQIAGPFLLISVGQEDISSSLAGILVASAPIWTALLAVWVDHEERSHGPALLGVLTGMGGVALLLGVDTGGGGAALIGGLLVVLAGLGYAVGGFWLKRHLSEAQPVGVVTAAMAAGALMTLPFAALTAPGSLPGLEAAGAVTVLGVLGTGISFVLFYELIRTIGPAKTSLVAYVAPGFAVIYGVTLLGESFTAATAAGLALILGGSWLAAEARLPRRRPLRSPAKEVPVVNLRIRPSTANDAQALVRLAALDSSEWDGRQALLAEVDGELWAAGPLDGAGRVLADPFRPSADAVALLELRLAQLAQADGIRRRPPPPRADRRLLRYLARA